MKGLSPQSVQTELECNWMASSGKVVYPEFSEALHVADGLEYDPRRPLVVGLDVPGTPAAVITQIDAFGRWCVLSNLSPPEDETIGYYEFFQALADHLQQHYATPTGQALEDLDLQFYGDPAGNTPIPRPGQAPKEARSCYDLLARGVEIEVGVDEHGRPIVERLPGWGWRVQPGAVNLTERMEAVRARLKILLRGGIPALVVDRRCRTVVEGFSGAYAYKQRSDGRYELDPEKNFWSHSMNALEYPATRLFAQAKDEEDEDAPRHEVRSRAAGRDRGRW
jgi:hypothetical protein